MEKYRNYLLIIANEDIDQNLLRKMGASDLVQESMIQAQQKFEQFRGQSEQEWKGWLRKILQNDLRKNRRQFTKKYMPSQLSKNRILL